MKPRPDSQHPEADHPFGQGLFGPLLATLGIALLGNLLLRILLKTSAMPLPVRLAVALGTALPLAWAAFWVHRQLRTGLDEMLRTILLEGMGFAFLAYFTLTGVTLNLRAAGLLPIRLDLPELLLLPALLLGWGIARSWRRFR